MQRSVELVDGRQSRRMRYVQALRQGGQVGVRSIIVYEVLLEQALVMVLEAGDVRLRLLGLLLRLRLLGLRLLGLRLLRLRLLMVVVLMLVFVGCFALFGGRTLAREVEMLA